MKGVFPQGAAPLDIPVRRALSTGDYTPDDLLAPAKPNESKLAEAMDFLKEVLSGGPMEQKVVKSKAAEAGVAYRTVERAKELLGVRSDREGWGPGSTCRWSMPTEGP